MRERRIDDIEAALEERRSPTITMWNRLEGRPRTSDFERALQAKIRDPLWMLARQWQLGEFRADDAGSPVRAQIHVATSPLDGYQAGDRPIGPFDPTMPLEAQVEQRPLPLHRGAQAIALDLRLLMGRQWLKMLRPIGDFAGDFVRLYPIKVPDPGLQSAAEICAHRDVWQRFAAVSGRAMDGYGLYEYLRGDPPGHAYDGTPIPVDRRTDVDILANRFVRWFDGLIHRPTTGEDAWRPEYLEYQFAVTVPDGDQDSRLSADAYHHGRLDWYALDADPSAPDQPVSGSQPDEPAPIRTFLPAPLDFEGMPNSRWWTFEDARSSFGDVRPDTTDLAKLMLIEFGLVYANDWFLFPLELPVGTTTRVRGLAVTNVFGERIWISAAGQGRDEDWQRWNMFTMSVRGAADVPADTRFLLPPTATKVQEGRPLEEVVLIRDEMANMVWGIETCVPLPDGRSKPGQEAAGDRRRFHERLVAGNPAAQPPAPAVPVRYQVMSNDVYENWIPFIPVHIPDNNREIQLQRASLPRIIARDPASVTKIRPLTSLLREGLDEGRPYFLHEEEVPRTGSRIVQAYQRTRWYDGRVILWLGAQKLTGRGEGAANLRFDQLVTVEQPTT